MALVEIIVSVMFLMIVVTGFIGTYSYLASRSAMIRNKRMALRLAQKRLEACLADPSLFTRSSVIQDITKDITIDEQRGLVGQLETRIDPGNNTVECSVMWTDGNVSLTTIWAN